MVYINYLSIKFFISIFAYILYNIMGLDISFYKTKRTNFKNLEKQKYDEDGDNIHKDDEIYYFRGNYKLRNYIQATYSSDINNIIVEVNEPLINELISCMPDYYRTIEFITFRNRLVEAINKGYVVYVVCDF